MQTQIFFIIFENYFFIILSGATKNAEYSLDGLRLSGKPTKKGVRIDINQIIVCLILFYAKKFVWKSKSAYLCTVFFIVLDLRLTKVGSQR